MTALLRIREFREKRGLTLEQLGAKIGMDPGHLSRIERGERPVTVDQLRQIARELECRPEDFLMIDSLHALKSATVTGVAVVGTAHTGRKIKTMRAPSSEHYSIDVPKDERLKNPFALLLDDDTMERDISKGSHVVCVPLHDFWRALQRGDFLVVESPLDGGIQVFIRQLDINKDGQRILCARTSNPAYQRPGTLDESVTIRGVVVAAYKPLA
jgi:transcriptional regulator with XRE-family HTH domain